MKILVHYPFEPEQVEALRSIAAQHGDHQLLHATTDEDAVAQASDAQVIMGFFRPPVCAAAPHLRWVQSFSAGMDKFLFPEIIERDDVQVSNVAGLYAAQGAEHAWALLLALTRQLPQAVHNKDKKVWKLNPPIVLEGSTLGLIGMGGFGMEMAKRSQGYSMTILAVDAVRTDKPELVHELKPATRENLHDLLRRSDVVMTACPLTQETYHLISAEELALMKETAYLINVTRGGIIDEPALVDALTSGQIAGAGLDVVEKEPLAEDSPLWDAPNLIITPHRAGASQHRQRSIFEFFSKNLARYLSGETPLNIIDKRKGY